MTIICLQQIKKIGRVISLVFSDKNYYDARESTDILNKITK